MQKQSHASIEILEGATLSGVEKGQEILRTEKLRKTYRSGLEEITPLDNVDLVVVRGEITAIVGPSGAGKSTLLHLLAALDTPTSGTVYFAGKSLESFSEAERSEYCNRTIGFVWQRHHLLPDFTAAENVAMPQLIRGAGMQEALEKAEHWLGEVELGGRARQRAGELSGGEQQRVAIARALVNEPQVLLADEPTGDLDERSGENVFDLMQRLHRTHHLTSIFATHNRALAQRTDRVLALEHGKFSTAVETSSKDSGRAQVTRV